MTVSEPQDPEPFRAAARVRGLGAPEQMLGAVSSLQGSGPRAPRPQREDGAGAAVTGMWRRPERGPQSVPRGVPRLPRRTAAAPTTQEQQARE